MKLEKYDMECKRCGREFEQYKELRLTNVEKICLKCLTKEEKREYNDIRNLGD